MALLGEITLFGGNFAPVGWAFCNGQLLSISENDALYNLIGTTYGGDGQNTFGLPDLRGRIPIHQGTGGGATYVLGQMGGIETVTLTTLQIPGHSHSFNAAAAVGTILTASGSYPATDPVDNQTYSGSGNADMMQTGLAGGSLPHDNLPPYLCVSFIIAIEGIYPQQ